MQKESATLMSNGKYKCLCIFLNNKIAHVKYAPHCQIPVQQFENDGK